MQSSRLRAYKIIAVVKSVFVWSIIQFMQKPAKSGTKGDPTATPFVCLWYCLLN